MAQYARIFARIIQTGLENTELNRNIISSVFGQMSDGMWENSPHVTPYWTYAWYTSSNTNIYVSLDNSGKNPYNKMSDGQIINYFANKIRHIVRQELKDEYIARVVYPSCLRKYHNFSNHSNHPEKLKELMDVYLKEHPFRLNGWFNSNNTQRTHYLSKSVDVRVQDAYQAYTTMKKIMKVGES